METTSSSEYPIDNWIATVKECKYLPEEEMKKLCDLVSCIASEIESIPIIMFARDTSSVTK